jgi:hypothetical protein
MAWLGRYRVQTEGDLVWVVCDDEDGRLVTEQTVAGLGAFIAQARALCLGQQLLPAGEPVLYLFDWADACYGYALNLEDETRSGWGHAPFQAQDPAA